MVCNLARQPKYNGKLSFPFFTNENSDIMYADQVTVGDYNNLPFSSSRLPNVADSNEFFLLSVPHLLQTK